MELPKIINESLEVEMVRDKVNGKKKKITFESNVDEWNLHTFSKYFEYLYQFKFNKPYIPNKGDLKQLKRVLENREKDEVKHYMKTFMELDFFEVKTLRIFCSNYSQVVLDNYTSTGNLPYKKKGAQNEPEDLSDWDEQIEELGWNEDKKNDNYAEQLKDLGW